MKGTLLLLLAMLGFMANSSAQTKISGRVLDISDKLKLKNASIMLLRAQDSLLVDYTRADENGYFEFPKPTNGDHLIVVSYPKYADFFEEVKAADTKTDLGEILLSSVAHLIEEVVVKRRAAITIKGDTTEYDASQFTVEKNAKVEDLLKVLPGITVDAAGNITAQGKTVKKVLVDGEEFFGDDPTLVTRNLRSDMVDKVQVYEKKSDQAERTGVDDGVREQTINVQLKDDAKNGMFGKALAGGGTDDYYMGQLMLNMFKGSKKLSAYGLFGNNGTTSMNWQDAQKYGIDMDASYEGGVMVVNDPFSGQGVIGIPRVINSGINFNDRWKKDKYQLNLSYKYGKLQADGNEETIMSGVINSTTNKLVDTDNDQHRLNFRLDTKIDSLNQFLITANASKKLLWSRENIKSQNSGSDLTPLSSNVSDEEKDHKVDNMGISALYTKKFTKAGRSLSLNFGTSNEQTTGYGFLYSTLDNKLNNTKDTTDQYKNTDQRITSFQGGITYSEPLSKVLNISVGYDLTRVANESLIESFNKGTSNQYNELDEEFSSNYDYNRFSNNYKLAFIFNKDKFTANLTNNFNDDHLKQVNNYSNNSLERNFFTYNPSLVTQWKISTSKNLRISYNGKNQLPSLNQIQPILNNSDRLNQYIGNENLNPSFSNTIEGFFHSFNILSNQFKYIGGTFNLIKDPIVQNITTEDGVNYYRWDNINGKNNMNLSAYAGYHFRLYKDLVLDNSISPVFSISRNHNFVDGDANEVNSQTYSLAYEIKRETKTGFNFSTRFTPQYRQMTSNLSPEQDNNGFVFTSGGSFEYFFSKTFKIYTNFDYSYEAPTAAFDQKIERFLIHPGVSKKFLKNESLVLDFMINDVLNQNIGYSRMQTNSIFMQRRFDTIQRYYMLKLSWDFTKMFIK
ncbi:outer membrane beta-barrel protein [Sphingobacterium litopenaei]|uniref:Outer membrane beta-barrel protein n=1 Tax=Sphingobacterium litopenaei TaxID=2763500 RepID=A0ABR7YI91_9SPHI|nr:outer membrane beta-barrel protein [Sphingobacterium litopenaei]MBD1431000.1 outer membrane beta-barrel protein [Sphingobacterium litopenaei]